MSSLTLKPVACRVPPVTGANASHLKVSKVAVMKRQALPPPQVEEKEKPLLQESFTGASRREMMRLTAASLGLLPLLSPASAEARTNNASILEKIIEKFEELRQKAGLSKPKEEEGPETKPKAGSEDTKSKLKDETEKKAKPNYGSEEKKPTSTPELSTTPQNGKPYVPKEKQPVPEGEPSVPALPSIVHGKTVETTSP